jgi:hypothetical protein
MRRKVSHAEVGWSAPHHLLTLWSPQPSIRSPTPKRFRVGWPAAQRDRPPGGSRSRMTSECSPTLQPIKIRLILKLFSAKAASSSRSMVDPELTSIASHAPSFGKSHSRGISSDRNAEIAETKGRTGFQRVEGYEGVAGGRVPSEVRRGGCAKRRRGGSLSETPQEFIRRDDGFGTTPSAPLRRLREIFFGRGHPS